MATGIPRIIDRGDGTLAIKTFANSAVVQMVKSGVKGVCYNNQSKLWICAEEELDHIRELFQRNSVHVEFDNLDQRFIQALVRILRCSVNAAARKVH